jgi:hypothetical protein
MSSDRASDGPIEAFVYHGYSARQQACGVSRSGVDQETPQKLFSDSATVEHIFDESPWGARVSVARPEGLEPPTF